jgi:hypothetical protein
MDILFNVTIMDLKMVENQSVFAKTGKSGPGFLVYQKLAGYNSKVSNFENSKTEKSID